MFSHDQAQEMRMSDNVRLAADQHVVVPEIFHHHRVGTYFLVL